MRENSRLGLRARRLLTDSDFNLGAGRNGPSENRGDVPRSSRGTDSAMQTAGFRWRDGGSSVAGMTLWAQAVEDLVARGPEDR